MLSKLACTSHVHYMPLKITGISQLLLFTDLSRSLKPINYQNDQIKYLNQQLK